MIAELRLAPALAVAWRDLAAQLRATPDADLLLPNVRASRYAARVLTEVAAPTSYNFYSLAERITGQPRADDSLIRMLLRQTLSAMQAAGELTTFAPVATFPGFEQLLIEWLREIKQVGATTEQVRAAIQNERDRQLAGLYKRYQAWLDAHDRYDAEGLLWHSAERVERGDVPLPTTPLLLIGFDQFNPLQLRLLNALSRHRPITITLLAAPQDEARRGMGRLRRAQQRIVDTLQPAAIHCLPDAGATDTLGHLRRALFATDGVTPRPNDGRLRATTAPTREDEVRAALRHVKALLDQGVASQDIAIAAPEPARYARLIDDLAQQAALPLAVAQPLLQQPILEALVNLLQLAPHFPWRSTMAALDSPYVRQPFLDEAQRQELALLSRQRPVVEGRGQWWAALEPRDETNWDAELGPTPRAAELDEDSLRAIRDGLAAFFDRLTPPPSATGATFVGWIESALLGDEEEDAAQGDSLALRRAAAEGPFNERDMPVLRQAMDSAHRLAASLRAMGRDRLAWPAFRSELLAQWGRENFVLADPNRVPLLHIGEARAIPVVHLIVLGMSEGEFPTAPTPDPLYSPQERRDSPLDLATPDDEEDEAIWWQEVGRVSGSLHLLRPRLDERHAAWPASPLWQATLATVIPSPLTEATRRLGALPTPDEALDDAERLLAAVDAPDEALATRQPMWDGVLRGVALMQQRNSLEIAGPFEGMIDDAELQRELAAQFAEARRWSVSRLNDYHRCPYGFFARHVLALEPQPSPPDGMTPAQRGSLIHHILESVVAAARDQACHPCARHAAPLAALLDQQCDRIFAFAPLAFGFRPSALWPQAQQEIRQMLHALLRWECEINDVLAHPFQPYHQEWRFGIDPDGADALTIEHDGVRLRLRGVVDRIDRDRVGRLRIIDYKSGATPITGTDVAKGRSMQVALYALAVERLLPDGEVAESFYLHLPNRKQGGFLAFNGSVQQHGTVREALDKTVEAVRGARTGRFPSAPSKPHQERACSPYCELAALCRVSRAQWAKAAMTPEEEGE